MIQIPEKLNHMNDLFPTGIFNGEDDEWVIASSETKEKIVLRTKVDTGTKPIKDMKEFIRKLLLKRRSKVSKNYI